MKNELRKSGVMGDFSNNLKSEEWNLEILLSYSLTSTEAWSLKLELEIWVYITFCTHTSVEEWNLKSEVWYFWSLTWLPSKLEIWNLNPHNSKLGADFSWSLKTEVDFWNQNTLQHETEMRFWNLKSEGGTFTAVWWICWWIFVRGRPYILQQVVVDWNLKSEIWSLASWPGERRHLKCESWNVKC